MIVSQSSTHFIGIGGSGMSALAEVLLSRGHAVSGSDLRDQPRLQHLRCRGARIHLGHDYTKLGTPDLVVISSAIPADNPELLAARRQAIPIMTRGELLAHLTRQSRSVVVAGTHGKTTTGALVAHVLRHVGWDPVVLLGGALQELGATGYAGGGDWVVTEGDESDGSFMLLHPDIGVVTSIENDHLVNYGSEHQLDEAFRRFARNVKPGGALIYNGDDPRVRACCSRPLHRATCVSYGVNQSSLGLRIRTLRRHAWTSTFTYQDPRYSECRGTISCPLPGTHNAYNCAAALLVVHQLGIPLPDAAHALSLFSGVQRRFECLIRTQSVTVLTDYGHHPTEVRATLNAAHRCGTRLITVFQPHRYTRTRQFLEEFAVSFSLPDVLVLTEIYSAGEPIDPQISGRTLYEAVRARRSAATTYCPTWETVRAFLKQEIKEGDAILFLGAGDIDDWARAYAQSHAAAH